MVKSLFPSLFSHFSCPPTSPRTVLHLVSHLFPRLFPLVFPVPEMRMLGLPLTGSPASVPACLSFVSHFSAGLLAGGAGAGDGGFVVSHSFSLFACFPLVFLMFSIGLLVCVVGAL